MGKLKYRRLFNVHLDIDYKMYGHVIKDPLHCYDFFLNYNGSEIMMSLYLCKEFTLNIVQVWQAILFVTIVAIVLFYACSSKVL